MQADAPSTGATVAFPAGIYSLDSVKKAAYRLSDKLVVDIASDESGIRCTLSFLGAFSQAEADALIAAFKLEVLDQDLRESIAAETGPLRNAILAFAFSKTGLQSE